MQRTLLCYGVVMAAKKQPEQALAEQWRDILALHARTQCELGPGTARARPVRERLRGSRPVLAESAAAGRRLRLPGPGDLRPGPLSQSALSRLIGRLEKDGLVERAMCPRTGAGAVALTAKGRALHGEVRPVQRAVLARMLADAG